MKKCVTVKELREMLQNMEAQGFGSSEVVFLSDEDLCYELECGVHDVWYGENDRTAVVLG
jgi:hypothetical protein